VVAHPQLANLSPKNREHFLKQGENGRKRALAEAKEFRHQLSS
jgi:hypothetical protein